MNYRADQYIFDKKLFMLLIYTTIFILILDSGMWYLDGITGSKVRVIYYSVTILYYILNPLVPMIWYFYVDFYIFRSNSNLSKAQLFMMIPFVANMVLSIMSAFGNYLFYIDASNMYHRGRLFITTGLICLFYLLISIYLLVSKRKIIKKEDYLPLLAFALPPTIGSVIQNFNYGVSLIWVCVTISILIIFLGIQNDRLYRDYLTGLYNRRQLDNFLLTKAQAQGGMISGLMIDIDDFKSINDKYGHKSGDEALISSARILTDTFGKDSFISRYGGDEFVVIIETKDEQELKAAVNKLLSNVERFNRERQAEYTLRFSIGYDLCTTDDISSFIERIDKLMYSHKKSSR